MCAGVVSCVPPCLKNTDPKTEPVQKPRLWFVGAGRSRELTVLNRNAPDIKLRGLAATLPSEPCFGGRHRGRISTTIQLRKNEDGSTILAPETVDLLPTGTPVGPHGPGAVPAVVGVGVEPSDPSLWLAWAQP